MRVSCTLSAGVAAAAAVAVVAGCRDELPAQGQGILWLDTDAPVSGSAEERNPEDDSPAALFDRVRIEIFPSGASEPCAECVREVAASAEAMRERRLSFGWTAPPRVVGHRVRLRLYRSAGRAEPRLASSIELVGFLPALPEEGIVELTATLRTDDVGRPRGSLAAPIVFEHDRPTRSLVGTWPHARVVPCSLQPREGAVCIPGAAFFVGDPRVTPIDPSEGGALEHLVVLAPFSLDAHEVTVGELRTSKLAVVDSRGRAVDPRDDAGDDLAGSCDYTVAPGPWEDRPVDCVSFELAQAYCKSRGGDLPTEAQLERVATRRGSVLAPWGNEPPACDEAAIGRGRTRSAGGCVDGEADPFTIGPPRILPDPAGRGTRDRVEFPSGTVVDLGANLSEWTRDSYASDAEPCWSSPFVATDPECVVQGRTAHSVKGANVKNVLPPYFPLRKSKDTAIPTIHQYAEIGFRCAYSD